MRNNIYLADNSQRMFTCEIELKQGVRIGTFGNLSIGNESTGGFDQDRRITDNSLLINNAILKLGYDYIKNKWASIMNSGICRKVAQEASSLSSESYVDLTLEPFFQSRQSINVFLKDGRRIRLGDLGEGMQSYIVSKILFEAEKPDILLWDDIEAHFNPRMLISLAQWFADIVDNGKQVILSTHSLEAVRIISEMVPDKTSIILLSLKDNILNTKSLSANEIAELNESGVDIRIAEKYLL